MKKLVMTVLAFSLFSLTYVHSAGESLVSIDSMLIMQKSKEGKVIDEKIQKKIKLAKEYYEEGNKKLAKMQEEINTKADILSPMALQEKNLALAQEKKNFERAITDKQEELRNEVQREQMTLHSKQMAVANKLFEEEKWGLLIDKNANGVLFVSKAIDKTALVLEKVDAEFDAIQKKNTTSVKADVAKTTNKAKKELRTV